MREIQAKIVGLVIMAAISMGLCIDASADQRARALVTANITMTQNYGNQVLIGNLSATIECKLPPSPRAGQVVDIQDAFGVVGSSGNVTIKPASGNINGAPSITLSTAWGGKRCIYSGTQWVAR